MSSMIILPPVVLMVSLFRRLDFLRTSFHPFFHKGQSQVERVLAALTRYSPNTIESLQRLIQFCPRLFKRHLTRDLWSCQKNHSNAHPTPTMLRKDGRPTAISSDGSSHSSVLPVGCMSLCRVVSGITSCIRSREKNSQNCLRENKAFYIRWNGSRCTLWNQLWQQTDLPVVDRHDGEPLCQQAYYLKH